MIKQDDDAPEPEFSDAVLRQFPDIDQTLATWRSILVGGFHGNKNPQTPMSLVTLARLFDIVAMANNLLCRMAGLGAIEFVARVSYRGLEAIEAEDTIEPLLEAKEIVLREGPHLAEQPPMQPALLTLALVAWVRAQTFGPEDYLRDAAAYHNKSTGLLLARLGLLGPAALAQVQDGKFQPCDSSPPAITPNRPPTPREIAADLSADYLARIFHRYPAGNYDADWVLGVIAAAQRDPDLALLRPGTSGNATRDS
jgi:hypothetical protein